MKLHKITAILIITVMLAACEGQSGSGGCKTSADCASGQTCIRTVCRSSSSGSSSGSSSSTTAGGVSIDVNAPESIFADVGEKDSFSIAVTAGDDDLRQPNLIISNFGPYISSKNCEGSITLDTIDARGSKDVECEVEVRDSPSSDKTQELEYELDWTSDFEVQVDDVEIMTPDKFELESPSQSNAKASVKNGPASMTLLLEDVPAKTGERIAAKLSIDAESGSRSGVKCIESEGSCSHHIDEVKIKVPSGFQVTGLSGYSSTRCGEGYTCYSKDKVKLSDGKYEEEFSLTLQQFASNVNKQTFLFGAYASGVRFYEIDSFDLNLEAP